MNQVQKMAPAWHAEAKEIIAASFLKDHAIFLDSTKRAVWWGMFFNHIKARGKEDGSIPHGKFGAWLSSNAPKEISWPLANTYMRLGNGVCEKGDFQIIDFLQFAQSGQLPPKIAKMIEGKTQQQLFLEFKNVDADGEPLRPGCKPGKRGKVQIEIADPEAAAVADGMNLFWLTAQNLADAKDLTINDTPSDRLSSLKYALKEVLDKIEKTLAKRRQEAHGKL